MKTQHIVSIRDSKKGKTNPFLYKQIQVPYSPHHEHNNFQVYRTCVQQKPAILGRHLGFRTIDSADHPDKKRFQNWETNSVAFCAIE